MNEDENMGITRQDIEATVSSFLSRVGKPAAELTPATALFADGVGLDSLETAELSAVLEDEYGTDPFTADTIPQTVGDIVAFYRVDVTTEV
jgi:acyl carrier protein